MRFKELSIALFMTILFLGLPITQAVSFNEVNKMYNPVSAVSSFKVKLTEEQLLTATNAAGESAPSAEASATTLAPPAAPATLSATAGDGCVLLAWSNVTNADNYSVKRSTAHGSGYTISERADLRDFADF